MEGKTKILQKLAANRTTRSTGNGPVVQATEANTRGDEPINLVQELREKYPDARISTDRNNVIFGTGHGALRFHKNAKPEHVLGRLASMGFFPRPQT